MNKLAVFLVLFIIILAAIGYYVNIDKSDVSFENVDNIVDEAHEVGENLEKDIPDYIDEQIDSFS